MAWLLEEATYWSWKLLVTSWYQRLITATVTRAVTATAALSPVTASRRCPNFPASSEATSA